jgi:hypothetical protein
MKAIADVLAETEPKAPSSLIATVAERFSTRPRCQTT